MLFRRAFDSLFNQINFVGIIFCRVFFMIDVIPGGANVFGRVNRIFVVGRIGKLDITVFLFSLFGINIIAPINFL